MLGVSVLGFRVLSCVTAAFSAFVVFGLRVLGGLGCAFWVWNLGFIILCLVGCFMFGISILVWFDCCLLACWSF